MAGMERILVGLDLTDMDNELILYTSYLDKVYNFQHITFIHIALTLELPREILKDYPDLMAPLDETIQREMEDKINGIFAESKADIEFKVVDGHPEVGLLKWVRIKDADLLILGKKRNERGAGVVPSKVGRAATTSVLILPEGSKIPIQKILVIVDFSEHSELSLTRIIEPAKKLGAELFIEHVYYVPTGYTKTGKTFEEFAEIMLKNSRLHMQEFLRNCGLSRLENQVVFRLDEGHDPSDEIMEAADELDIDLIVLGSKGRSDPAAFLLGSTAEKLVQRNYRTPVLIEKYKGSVMKFLEALLEV
jgi:nucleotide-binding universal stress UspA family protein